ncbi:uromodulin-like 1 [Pyrgilauda ruficollis]|uniref:uromodulin-like 1 n=1 Tax=Pyrgilauda ruficollis TaxID=221976 RepID=UPI001B88257D|nr:uromodulin-like 1 [Pyrgilauda ruficollis]
MWRRRPRHLPPAPGACAAPRQGRGEEFRNRRMRAGAASPLEKGLSSLGYHLCNYTLTKSVLKMVAYQKSYEKKTSCGRWIPWMVCPQTHHRTEFHSVEVPETITLTDCCEGYEQVGLYCSLGRMFWYNVTVLVKMDFNELIWVDSHLLNHSRLLHSVITGALQPLNASVHHIQSDRGDIYAGTVASQLLLGMHHPAPLAEVSSSLKAMVERVYEVIDAQVQDVNECSYAEFNACPEKSSCVNLEGSYSCHPQHDHGTVIPHWLSPRKEVTNHRILSVTSNSFGMSWLVSSTLNHTFQVRVAKGNETVQNLKTEELQLDVSHLEAGVMYSVEISYETCGKTIISRQNVKTEAKIFDVTMRILNYNFTDDFHNSSSSTYEEFSRLLLTELENSFPPNISALYKSGKLKVQIESLAAGSIVVKLRITVQDPEFPVDASTFAPVLSNLHNGSVLVVDQQNTAVEDWDECASLENDCSVFAECINLMGSYTCRCKTTMDTNPSRPGRNCEGEIVDPFTETVAPETRTSMDLAPEEGRSPAGPAPAAAMGTVAAAGRTSSAATLLPAALALAFQKLSGTVWITNMEYSPGFSNNSSEENQTFARLFVDEVQKSLPLEVLQQMDAGLIKVLVTGVTNGSTVVSFNLLLAEEVDVHHVITTFCEALENSSSFTVDRSSLSIHAHVSSPASLDFSPAEHKALEDTMFSSTVLSPLPTDPMATPDISPRASPAPLVKPAQEVSLKDAVSVFCEIERIVLAIQKRFLQQESIPESSLFLGEPGCNVSTSNGTHVVLQAGWSACGTQVETNMTTTVVRTTLRNDASAQGIIHHLNVASPIHCVFQNHVLTSSGYTAEGPYTIFEDLHGSGYFRTEMQLFIGNSPVPKNFSVSASEDVLIEVGMQKADSQLKVVLTDCWATPTNNSMDPLAFVFISNSCPIPNTYTTLLENGNSSKAQFKMKIFSFVNNSVVYLHCRIHICMESPGSTCRTRCHARARLLKAGETIALHRTSWGPLCKSAGIRDVHLVDVAASELLQYQYNVQKSLKT